MLSSVKQINYAQLRCGTIFPVANSITGPRVMIRHIISRANVDLHLLEDTQINFAVTPWQIAKCNRRKLWDTEYPGAERENAQNWS